MLMPDWVLWLRLFLAVGADTQRSTIDKDTKDTRLVVKFVDAVFAPALLDSIGSDSAAERSPALKALERISLGSKHSQACQLVKENSTWKLLENAALGVMI